MPHFAQRPPTDIRFSSKASFQSGWFKCRNRTTKNVLGHLRIVPIRSTLLFGVRQPLQLPSPSHVARRQPHPPPPKKTAGVQGDERHPLASSFGSAPPGRSFVEEGGDGLEELVALLVEMGGEGCLEVVEAGVEDGDFVLEGLEAGCCGFGLGLGAWQEVGEAIAGAGFGGRAGGRALPLCLSLRRQRCLVVQRVEGALEGEGIEAVARHARAARVPLAEESMIAILRPFGDQSSDRGICYYFQPEPQNSRIIFHSPSPTIRQPTEIPQEPTNATATTTKTAGVQGDDHHPLASFPAASRPCWPHGL